VLITCHRGDKHKFITTLDENGRKVSINLGHPKYGDSIYKIKETLSLGGEEPIPKVYQPIGRPLIDNEGNIYLTDENRIKKFSKAGTFLYYIGSRGDGPGEVKYPYLEKILGDTIVVDHGRSKRGMYELFKIDGTFINRLYDPIINTKWYDDSINRISAYIGQDKFIFMSSRRMLKGNYNYDERKYGLICSNGDFINWLEADYISNAVMFRKRTHGGFENIIIPYTTSPTADFENNKIYLSMSGGTRIYIYSLDGTMEKLIELNIKGAIVTKNERIQIVSKMKSRRPASAAHIDDPYLPKWKPLGYGLIVDEDRNIWMNSGEDYYNEGSKSYQYLIIDRKGEYICKQELPINLFEIKKNHAYGFSTNIDGLRIFKSFKLKKK
jgi:hypothetical protein